MEEYMSKNRIVVYVTILLFILLIAIPTLYKTFKRHNNRLLGATTKKIIEKAKDCYYNESCIEDKITLQELYEKTDLKELTNPITKKIYNPESYVLVSKNFKFIEK